MNIREELLQYLYYLMNNENLCENLQNKFSEAEALCSSIFPEDKECDYMNALCNLEHAAFMAGANMVLDFMAGREVH